ncbi:hypothetical protein GCM10011494_26600 [Novosphingobium endophyticum]|uniref:SDR family NAD(P)-dependent oxidoreductase n=1 Tax=Novosphingobium endophyticum TaxID=1955250 RepID=A0A916TTH5_9SPHN|nr:SDR family NAD(P)-dependent oxidoreductase [Novosphingobium endophyticum]GGC06667.1 hypothetical protein GCM10011494_26600 [Novosphingobium endophyticum]
MTVDRSAELAGNVAVITGAASGIGQGLALGFLQAGASVVAADIKVDTATRGLAADGGLADRLHEITADVTQDEDVACSVATARDRFGRIDIMVNNAGGPSCSPSLYAAAKAAVVRMSAMAAVELAPWRIRVNTVSPEPIMVPGFADNGGSAERLIAVQPWPEAPR